MGKTVTNQDIKDAFFLLIEEEGSTSNMEVKEYLRDQGFWVFQQTVRDFIDDNYQSMGLERTNNGRYNIYEEAQTMQTQSNSSSSVSGSAPILVTGFSNRQLLFRKDSCAQLNYKLKNPKYSQFHDKIQEWLDKRAKKQQSN